MLLHATAKSFGTFYWTGMERQEKCLPRTRKRVVWAYVIHRAFTNRSFGDWSLTQVLLSKTGGREGI